MGCEESNMHSNLQAKTEMLRMQRKLHKRRNNVTAEMNENVRKTKFEMKDEDEEMINETIKNHPILFKLPSLKKRDLIDSLKMYEADKDQKIFKKGDPSSMLFIVKQGQVMIEDFTLAEHSIILDRGKIFGDLGLIYSAPRSATARALSRVELFGMSRLQLERACQQISKKYYNIFKDYLSRLAIFKHFPNRIKNNIAYCAKEIRLHQGDIIFRHGEDANCFYVRQKGRVIFDAPGKVQIELKGQCFGENCLKSGSQKRSATATCLNDVVLYSFSRNDIYDFIGGQFEIVETNNKLAWALRRDHHFKHFGELLISQMIANCKILTFKEGQTILPKGALIEHLLICLEGSINNEADGFVFNTEAIEGEFKYVSQSLVKNVDGRVCFLEIKAIESSIGMGCRLSDLIRTTAAEKTFETSVRSQEYIKNLKLADFYVLTVLADGYFGPTLHVVEKESNIQFALRAYDREKLKALGMSGNLQHQKHICQMTQSCPMLVKHYRGFKQPGNIYLLNRLIEGKDLLEIMLLAKSLELNVVRHFTACIVLALEAMHAKNIVYRNLKLENLMLDKEGYLNVVDYFVAKDLETSDNARTFTIVGSAHYLAPEVFEGLGYGLEADLWALGVVVYFMLTGSFPFGGNEPPHAGEDDLDEYTHCCQQVYESIRNKGLTLPSKLSVESKDFLAMLLNYDSLQRSKLTFVKIKQSSFFYGYSWKDLAAKKIELMPMMPTIDSSPPVSRTPLAEYMHQDQLDEANDVSDWDKDY